MGAKIRVLMVDDEYQFRATTQKILNQKGFEALLAASGEEALDKLSQMPDVVVLDIKMPGMDGHETLTALKQQAPELPVIMLTGHGTRPSAREAQSEGAFDYLSKPCDINLLAEKIREAYRLGRHGEEKEKSVAGIMVPLGEYTVLSGDETLTEAVSKLKESFVSRLSTSSIMETGHRSILIMNQGNRAIGILTIMDLITYILPSYLSAPKPSTADSIQYSPLFWNGMFSKAVKESSQVRIKEIMSPSPLTIEGEASLMEAAYLMKQHGARRLIVIQSGKVAGIVREQDLFFEIERILSRTD